MPGPIDGVYPDGVPVQKGNVRANDRTAIRRNISDVSTVQSTDLSGQFAGIYVRSIQANFDLDTSDTTSPHNGTTVLVDGAGNIFKIVLALQPANNLSDVSDPAIALENLGGLARAAAFFGFHNRIINPSGQIAQAGVASTSDGAYTGFDQWLALTQSNAVTPSALTNVENGTPFMMRLLQANATPQRYGWIQWIESANCIDLRGQAVTLSARVRMSAATTLRYAIVEWTGTADAITKDIVNDWTNSTFTAGNFFKSTTTTIVATGSVALSAATLTSVSLSGTISGSANNLAVFFWTDSTQAQNVTLDIGKVQLEAGSTATPLAVRSLQEEMSICQRYLVVNASDVGFAISTTAVVFGKTFSHPMMVAPTVASATGGGVVITNTGADFAQSSFGVTPTFSARGGHYRLENYSGLLSGAGYALHGTTGPRIIFKALL